MNGDAFLKALNEGHVQMQPVSSPGRVVEIDDGEEPVIFDLNDIAIIRNIAVIESTDVYLKCGGSFRLQIPYEKFKDLIGANPIKLEVADEA